MLLFLHSLVIDDFALTPLSGSEPSDLLEVLDDRSERKSTIVTSQLPVDSWHQTLGDPIIRGNGPTTPQCSHYRNEMSLDENKERVKGGDHRQIPFTLKKPPPHAS